MKRTVLRTVKGYVASSQMTKVDRIKNGEINNINIWHNRQKAFTRRERKRHFNCIYKMKQTESYRRYLLTKIVPRGWLRDSLEVQDEMYAAH